MLAVFLAAVVMMFVNGLTDAPVTVASAVCSKSLHPKTAGALAAVFGLLGAVWSYIAGNRVAESVLSVGGRAVFGDSLAPMLLSAFASVSLWALFALRYGIPTSESHGLLAALTGSVAAVGGFGTVNLSVWLKILYGILLSVAPVIMASAVLKRLLCKTTLKEHIFKRLQIFGAMCSAFSHGAQDSQKFAAVVFMATVSANRNPAGVETPLWAVLFCGTVISLGTLKGGNAILQSFRQFAPATPAGGFASDVVSATSLLILTAFGIPAATTYAKTSAVFGAGYKKARSKDLAFFGKMFVLWLLTFPVCFFAGYILAKLFVFMFNPL